MVLKKIAGISAAALIAALMSSSLYAEDGKYLQDSYGVGVKDSYGKCVLAMYGSMPEGCEEAVEPPPPPPPPRAAPHPRPRPHVAPRPRPAPPPPPPPMPKVKGKGIYKGPVMMDDASRGAMRQYQH